MVNFPGLNFDRKKYSRLIIGPDVYWMVEKKYINEEGCICRCINGKCRSFK
uniref:Uncharacterized protein n=1 Tax=Anguilla anguilla TaxID=7936 RepID=A0A0E9QFQ8_ANGAN